MNQWVNVLAPNPRGWSLIQGLTWGKVSTPNKLSCLLLLIIHPGTLPTLTKYLGISEMPDAVWFQVTKGKFN